MHTIKASVAGNELGLLHYESIEVQSTDLKKNDLVQSVKYSIKEDVKEEDNRPQFIYFEIKTNEQKMKAKKIQKRIADIWEEIENNLNKAQIPPKALAVNYQDGALIVRCEFDNKPENKEATKAHKAKAIEIIFSALDKQHLIPPILKEKIVSKQNFITQLQAKLNGKSTTRADILDLFSQIKDPNGKYSFIHPIKDPNDIFIHQKNNSKWDALRSLFKRNRNPDEKKFWHTATFQKAVKLLKEAYLAREDDSSVLQRKEEETAFVNYVCPNSPLHTKETSSQKIFKKSK